MLTQADLTTGPFRYEKTSNHIGKLNFTNWTHDSETYTGTFTLTFTSDKAGTFYKNYTGTYQGYISGSFVILGMDAVGRRWRGEKPCASSLGKTLDSVSTAKAWMSGRPGSST